jgi:DNA-binding transcriptional LysR family regulator
MLDRLTGMQVFLRAAALGSVSAAARALGLSPTMATKHLAAIEARLGTRLLHRTTRRLTLTEAGRRFQESAERILAEMEEAEATAQAEQVEPRGLLRVNAPLSFGLQELAPLLPDFARRHPGMRIELGLNDRIIDLVEEGWDLAIRIARLPDSRLVARRLAGCRLLVAAAPAYLAAHGTPRRVAELSGHDCLGYTLSSRLGAQHWDFGAEGQVSVPVRGSLAANNGDVLVAAAIAGQGIVYQPDFLLAAPLRRGELVALALDQPVLELPGVYAVHAGGRRPPAKLRALVDFLAERFGPVPPWQLG